MESQAKREKLGYFKKSDAQKSNSQRNNTSLRQLSDKCI